jgi:hypothetical protein
VSPSNLYRPFGEIPEGRAELVLSLCAYARQRTLEPVLEPGVAGNADLWGIKPNGIPSIDKKPCTSGYTIV